MCIHYRVIYRECNHWNWGAVAVKCNKERRFDSGRINVGCSTMESSPMKTIKVGHVCKACAKRRAATDMQFSKVRDVLRELRRAVDSMVQTAAPGGSGSGGANSSTTTPDDEGEDDDAAAAAAAEEMDEIDLDATGWRSILETDPSLRSVPVLQRHDDDDAAATAASVPSESPSPSASSFSSPTGSRGSDGVVSSTGCSSLDTIDEEEVSACDGGSAAPAVAAK